MRSRLVAVLVPLLVLAMGVVGTAAAEAGSGPRTDVIVVLHDGTDARDAAADTAREHRAEISYVYEHALQGFAASVPDGRLRALQRDPRVASIEVDRVQSIQAQEVPTGIQRIDADTNANLQINGDDAMAVDVDVAIVDTGIDLEHPDLNVAGGVDCTVSSGGGPPWARNYYCSSTDGTGGDDDHYHGTHVAGTVGAVDNDFGVVGVAPGARLWAVKVLDSSGSGYTSGIVAGIDWVVARGDIEVLNMSLGGSGSCDGSAYDTAITNAVRAGVAVAVAAGNSGADAANYSPASCEDAFTVSALADFDGEPGGNSAHTCRTDEDDTLANFSNWGSTVQVAAPGVCITSTYPIEQGSYGTISGTSMASPHVAGALALLASVDNPDNATDVWNLYDDVMGSGTYDWTDEVDGVEEPLLNVSGFGAALVAYSGGSGGGGGGGGGGSEEPPTEGDFALTATGEKVKGTKSVDLSWDDTNAASYDVLRDGAVVDTVATTTWSEGLGKGGGTYTYQVCEAGTTTCSNVETVAF